MIEAADIKYLNKVRNKLFAAIKKSFLEDSHCKHYEGAISIHVPNYFEQNYNNNSDDKWSIDLHCYVVGPSRHYTWPGPTLSCCIDKMDKDIDSWIKEEEEE